MRFKVVRSYRVGAGHNGNVVVAELVSETFVSSFPIGNGIDLVGADRKSIIDIAGKVVAACQNKKIAPRKLFINVNNARIVFLVELGKLGFKFRGPVKELLGLVSSRQGNVSLLDNEGIVQLYALDLFGAERILYNIGAGIYDRINFFKRADLGQRER